MASTIVYDGLAEGAAVETGALFEGNKFWVAQRVPSRLALLKVIQANGGRVVPLEKQADWLIADHFRRDSPPGTISYEFVTKSVEKGEILDPDDFPAGPKTGTARDPGSMVRPAKGTRAAYTPEEDRVLYKWVRDAHANGVPVSGNELYKKLEEKNPRHTWQSWRDRYLKKLQYMPPSAFNIPDNAPPSPPSPPSDQSSRAAELPAVKRTGLVKNKDKERTTTLDEPASMGTAPSKQQTATEAQRPSKPQPITNDYNVTQRPSKPQSINEYNVTQLAATFTTEDWEELYAFVEHIDSFAKDRDSYETSWTSWAENKDNQTAEQWRQYYEKVVRPQWLRDPVSKRDRIRKKVEERHQDDSSSPSKSQSWSQTQDSAVAASQAVDQKPQEPANSKRTLSNMVPSDSRLESESTAQHETPRCLRDGYESALKRIRGEADEASEVTEASRPTKVRRKIGMSSTSPEPEAPMHLNGTQEQPLDISSAASSQQAEGEQLLPEQAAPSQTQEQVAEVIDLGDEAESVVSEDGYEQVAGAIDLGAEAESEVSEDNYEQLPSLPRAFAEQGDEDGDADELESTASSTDLTHITPLPRPPRIPEDSDDSDDLPSNTPTPRAHKFAAFDTQAILSPSQNGPHISRLPRPPLDSSPPHHPDSEASTTQSLQEFSSYLKDNDDEVATQTQAPLTKIPRPASPTPSTTSDLSSAGSGDPDEPLAADEMDAFFASRHAAGFSAEFVSKALKRTRFRPGLATAVLEAWKAGQPLPDQRGVWAVAEDDMVQSGDGAALARLQRKHTLDGWGGITERMNFLRAWARR